MSPEEVIAIVNGFAGVVAQTPGPGDGSPEIAWGDTFFFYDPDDRESARRMPFATISRDLKSGLTRMIVPRSLASPRSSIATACSG